MPNGYQIPEQKGVFCYEYITALKQWDVEALPRHEASFSKLKNAGILEEEYVKCEKVLEDNKMTTLKKIIICYNSKAMVPLLVVLEKQIVFYRDRGVDMFKDAISFPV